MLIEFDRRIQMHKDTLDALEKRGQSNQQDSYFVRGQLEECERLRAFYMTQMVDKGRIVDNPNAQKENLK